MAKPTNVYEKSAPEAVDLEAAHITIYRAEQAPTEPDGDPGPLDGKRVMKLVVPGIPGTKIVELSPAMDAQVDKALDEHATAHGLTKKGA